MEDYPDDPALENYPDLMEKDEKTNVWGKIIIEIIETLVLAAVLFFLINTVTARIRVDGRSMEPSFHHGDYVLVYRLAYNLGEISRGDVVVFPSPLDPEIDFIKRIIALPGDTVEILNGLVYINGIPLEEDYIMGPPKRNVSLTNVPEGMVYVIGDNRNDSSDSRSWGSISVEDIIGKAIFVYWPLDAFGIVAHPQLIIP